MPSSPSIILDSITHMTAAHRGQAVLAMSHGGRYAGYYAASMGAGAVILNDAGVGRDRAGLAGIVLLDQLSVPAATTAHDTARIGDGAHGYSHGRLSAVNAAAAKLGLAIGMSARDAMQRLADAALSPASKPRSEAETRIQIAAACRPGIFVHTIDSNTLVLPEDAGHIVVTGSHGGLLGGRPESAIKVDVFAAVYSDAGFGIDNAGTTRLPPLAKRGIAAACVSTFSCHVGDGQSVYRDGVVSAINDVAAAHGGMIGMSTAAFVDAMVAARVKQIS